MRETRAGDIRRVGIELEFGALDAGQAALVAEKVLGGRVRERDRHHFMLDETSIGDVEIELDTRWADPDFLRAMSADFPEEVKKRMSDLPEKAGRLIGDVADLWLPTEIIAPPVPYDRIGFMVPLCEALAAHGATGTSRSIFGGFGLHLNVEVASLDAAYLTRITRAYLMLSGWLREETRIVLVRQLGHFIDPFPEDYARLVIDPDYAPDFDELLSDYIRLNPTRNRELDLLPILLHEDETAVRDRLPDEKINGRPAFHYRLPSCRLDEPDWKPLDDWSRWLVVERLAAEEALLTDLARNWLRGEDVPRGLIAELEAA